MYTQQATGAASVTPSITMVSLVPTATTRSQKTYSKHNVKPKDCPVRMDIHVIANHAFRHSMLVCFRGIAKTHPPSSVKTLDAAK